MADFKTDSVPLSASMVELKAELSRKKEEFKREKAANIHAVKGRTFEKFSLKKKLPVWDRKNVGVDSRAKRDEEIDRQTDGEDALLKSRMILEKKSMIYDAITSSANIPEEDGSDGYLVDFQRKVVDAIVEEKEARRREEEDEAERKALTEPIPDAVESDDEWVDYTDSLGRSRRCMKKDLKDITARDEDLSLSRKLNESVPDEASGVSKEKRGDNYASPHLMANAAYRQKMHQKWEEEARLLAEKGQEEIHYSNVRFDEIRTHGVGFYQFSKDEQEREAQMDKLNKLREETKDEKSRKDRIKDKRKALMEARLAKVKERRKLKTKETHADDDETEIGPKLSEADLKERIKEEEMRKIKEEAEKAAEEARKKHLREWDKKKVSNPSWKGDNYVESRRSERESEFAPPSMYFNDSAPQQNVKSGRNGNRRFQRNQNKFNDFPSDHRKEEGSSSRDYFASSSEPQNPRLSEASWTSDMPPSQLQNMSLTTDAPLSQQTGDWSDDPILPGNDGDSFVINSIPMPASGPTGAQNPPYSANAPPVDAPHMANSYDDYSDTGYHGREMSYGPQNFQMQYPHQHLQQYNPHQHNQWHQHPPSVDTLAAQSPYPDLASATTHITQPPPYPASVSATTHATQPTSYDLGNNGQTGYSFYQSHAQTSVIPTSNQGHVHASVIPTSNQGHVHPSVIPTSNQGQATSRQTSTGSIDDSGRQQKRSHSHKEPFVDSSVKKTKVPKSAILDNRFVLNSKLAKSSSVDDSGTAETSSDDVRVEAVPYKPGSFTKARFRHGTTSVADDLALPAPAQETSTQQAQTFSGGPLVYSKEQQLEQLQQMQEDENSENAVQVDEKVDEFLKSIRSGAD